MWEGVISPDWTLFKQLWPCDPPGVSSIIAPKSSLCCVNVGSVDTSGFSNFHSHAAQWGPLIARWTSATRSLILARSAHMLSTCCKRSLRWLAGRGGGAVILGWRCCVLCECPECLWCQAEETGSSLLPPASGRYRQCPHCFCPRQKNLLESEFLALSVEDVTPKGLLRRMCRSHISTQASFGLISTSDKRPCLTHSDSNTDKCGGNQIPSDG